MPRKPSVVVRQWLAKARKDRELQSPPKADELLRSLQELGEPRPVPKPD
jgi:hypothetical protein